MEVAEVLTRVVQNISRLEEGGSNRRQGNSDSTIEADEGTNSLIITADTDEMAALEAVIARLDIRRAQVLIEAIIVEMDVTEGQELGLQWLFSNDSGMFGSNISANEAQRQRNQGIADALLPDDGSENIGTRAVAGALSQGPGTTLGWGVVDEDLTMTVILNARKRATPISFRHRLADPRQRGGLHHRWSASAFMSVLRNTGTVMGRRIPFRR